MARRLERQREPHCRDGLSASTNYSFTVEATDAAGTSSASSAVSVTTSGSGGGSGNGRVLVGYWHDWETPCGSSCGIADELGPLSSFFSTYNGNGQFSFTVDPDETQAQFILDVHICMTWKEGADFLWRSQRDSHICKRERCVEFWLVGLRR